MTKYGEHLIFSNYIDPYYVVSTVPGCDWG